MSDNKKQIIPLWYYLGDLSLLLTDRRSRWQILVGLNKHQHITWSIWIPVGPRESLWHVLQTIPSSDRNSYVLSGPRVSAWSRACHPLLVTSVIGRTDIVDLDISLIKRAERTHVTGDTATCSVNTLILHWIYTICCKKKCKVIHYKAYA